MPTASLSSKITARTLTRRQLVDAALGTVAICLLGGCGIRVNARRHEDASAPSALDGLSWDELAELSKQIADASDEQEATALATEAEILLPDGTIDARQTKSIELADGAQARVRIAGLRADVLAGTEATAGLTLAFATTLAMRGMTAEPVASGGWETCALRSWLASDGLALLPDDLLPHIKPARKATSQAPGQDPSVTDDALWLFSESELGGEDYLRSNYAQPDSLLGEGAPYQLFLQGSANAASRKQAFVRASSTTGAWECWWERSIDAAGTGFLFRTYAGTHGSPIGYSPNFELGVCPGFCL